jgi:hypothetical protein
MKKIDNPLNKSMESLSYEEMTYMIPALVKFLIEQQYPLTCNQICKKMDEIRIEKGMIWKSKMNGPRLRKMINWIRSNEVLGIVGDDKGYLETEDEDLLVEQAERQEQRIESQLRQLQGTRNVIARIRAQKNKDPFGIKWNEVEPPKVKIEEDEEDFYTWMEKYYR